jgi:putative Holliday junction resolvase
LARSLGAKLLTKGTATAAVATAPMAVVFSIQTRRCWSTGCPPEGVGHVVSLIVISIAGSKLRRCHNTPKKRAKPRTQANTPQNPFAPHLQRPGCPWGLEATWHGGCMKGDDTPTRCRREEPMTAALASAPAVSPSSRQDIILKYYPLVRMIAGRMARRLPPSVDADELVNVGVIGLIDAIDRFDETRGVPFKSYAEIRIQGAMDSPLTALGEEQGRRLGQMLGRIAPKEVRIIASPLRLLAGSKIPSDFATLAELVATDQVAGFVIGYPVHMDGSEGARCQATRQFTRDLARQLPLPCLLQDERLSTVAVNRMMTEEADLSRARRADPRLGGWHWRPRLPRWLPMLGSCRCWHSFSGCRRR